MPIVPRQDGPSVGPNTSRRRALTHKHARRGRRPDAPVRPGLWSRPAMRRRTSPPICSSRPTVARHRCAEQDQGGRRSGSPTIRTPAFTNLRGINALSDRTASHWRKNMATPCRSIWTTSPAHSATKNRRCFRQAWAASRRHSSGRLCSTEANEFDLRPVGVRRVMSCHPGHQPELARPEAVDKAVTRIKAETYRQAQLLGKSAEWQEAQAHKLSSTGHRPSHCWPPLSRTIRPNADAYLKRYSPTDGADDILAVRSHITNQMDAQIGAERRRRRWCGRLPCNKPTSAAW